MLLKLFYKVMITLMSIPEEDTTRKDNYRSMYLMNMNAKILNKY